MVQLLVVTTFICVSKIICQYWDTRGIFKRKKKVTTPFMLKIGI